MSHHPETGAIIDRCGNFLLFLDLGISLTGLTTCPGRL
jgi:hypothetical protein